MRKNLPGKTGGKRWLIFALACVAALALMVPAMAHGHGHGHGGGGYYAGGNPAGSTSTGCLPVCEVEGCGITGQHVHDGVTYCGNYHGGGYYAGGNPTGSTSTGCVPVCEVDGCWITGQHVHDGVTYCGNYHEDGYCTGNCRASTTFAMRHHGSCHNGWGHH